MQEQELLPHLFRTEYRKLTAVLGKLFGLQHIEIAEDIASETFLAASEIWSIKGLPENPTAWLYTVAKNKAKDYLKHHSLFDEKVKQAISQHSLEKTEIEIDLSDVNISDSQLKMLFAVCHPLIPPEAQVGLALRILCGFGIEEIANAFLTNKETINKRLLRAKDKLRTETIALELPAEAQIEQRLGTVLTTIYLLFNEGYYSSSQDTILRQDLCWEAMRLAHLLTEHEQTNKPTVNALLALICFQASRFEARINQRGETILYHDQDASHWNKELIKQGTFYLNQAAHGNQLSKYHLEAGIAYWHTNQAQTPEKWKNILHLYNLLLQIEYSPMAALNRTYALSIVQGKTIAIIEAEKLNLAGNHLYHSLLGELYDQINNEKALYHFQAAFQLSKSTADKAILSKRINQCKM